VYDTEPYRAMAANNDTVATSGMYLASNFIAHPRL
jgi:hypothetical protein